MWKCNNCGKMFKKCDHQSYIVDPNLEMVLRIYSYCSEECEEEHKSTRKNTLFHNPKAFEVKIKNKGVKSI